MTEDNTREVFCLPPLAPETLMEDNESAWTRKWVIANTIATLFGSLTGVVALVVAVIALTS
ncbi:hypothetical protein LCGC14_1144830 [marine sediment metagenome]|uniref:Uncharacterized protein n=1 Tax=marine sediment metagenome TaxID=412755 RepID=A0A0F9PFA8_9ZZZZ